MQSGAAVLLVSAWVLWPVGPTLAQPASGRIWALSDSNTLLEAEQTPCPGSAQGASAGPAGATLPADFEQNMAQLEATLKSMDPSHPAYAQLQETVKRARALQAARNPKGSPMGKAPTPEAPAGSPARVDLAGALASLEEALESSISPKAWAQLSTLPQDVGPAMAGTAQALLKQRPLAAVGLLLRAHRAAPERPEPLVNLAGLANAYGFYWEAVALSEAAAARSAGGRMGWDLEAEAFALNNHGHALLMLGQPAAAEPLLRQAVKKAPLLAEARSNLALALGRQGRCPEAILWARMAQRRQPTSPATAEQAPPGSKAPELPSTAVDIPSAPDWAMAFDFSRAQEGRLPDIPLPVDVKEHVQALPELLAQVERSAQRALRAHERAMALWPQVQARTRALESNPSTRLTGQRVQAIIAPLNSADPMDPEVRRLEQHAEKVTEAFQAAHTTAANVLTQASAQHGRIKVEEEKGCGRGPRSPPCRERVIRKFERNMCAAGRTYASSMSAAARSFDEARRATFRRNYWVLSGLASNLSDPVLIEWANAQLEWVRLRDYQLLGQQLAMFYFTAGGYHGQMCRDGGEDTTAAELEDLGEQPVEPCDSGGNKYKVSAYVVEVSFECYKAEVEVELPWTIKGLDVFVAVGFDQSMRHQRDPKARSRRQLRDFGQPTNPNASETHTTVMIGVKATLEAGGQVGAEAGAKSGAYVTVNRSGQFVDAGIKGEVAASVGGTAGPVSGGVERGLGEFNVGIASFFPAQPR